MCGPTGIARIKPSVKKKKKIIQRNSNAISYGNGRVDPDRQDNYGRTPLHFAAFNGHTEVVKALLCDGRVNPD